MPAVLKQPAVNRDREGGLLKQNESVSIVKKSQETMAERRKGRPKGSPNKQRTLIPKDLADKFLDSVQPLLPPEHFAQMKDAVRSGKAISTVTEAKIMLKLLGPSLMTRLIGEYGNDAMLDPDLAAELGPVEKEFKKDTNERLKVWMDLLKLVHSMENKEDAAQGHSKNKPITEITIRRGIDAGRLAILFDGQSGSVGRDSDGTGRETITIGAIPDSISERQESVQDSVQESSVRILNDIEYRDVS